jgi:hypothetical protein
MATIITREVGATAKGSPLTNAELDANFVNLNTSKLEASNIVPVHGVDISTDVAGNVLIDVKNFGGNCKNTTSVTIPKGTPVYQTGVVGVDTPTVAPADAANPLKMPAIGVAGEDLAADTEGDIVYLGNIKGVNTSAFGIGDEVYVASGGGFTNVRPANGSGVLIQFLGVVNRVHVNNGSGIIFGTATAQTQSLETTDSVQFARVAADNLALDGNTISATGNLVLAPTGYTDAGAKRITNLAEPVAGSDAATKQYVDAAAEGLLARPAVRAATTGNLAANYNNGVGGVGATLTNTANGAFPLIDDVEITTTNGGRGVLVRAQTNAAHNGRYNLTDLGSGTTPWVLTRCGLCDQAAEIPGSYTFVQAGTLYANTGWVQTVANPSTFTVGTDAINVVQFSGAGTFTAGTGLILTGTEFALANTAVAAGSYGSSTQIPQLVIDAQGRVTGASNNSITVGAGDLTVNTSGTGLSGSGTFNANSAGNQTITISSNATSANTANTLVARDGSGNFSAGTITAQLTGNASTATKWATARTVSLNGDVTSTSGGLFDGTSDFGITTALSASGVAAGTYGSNTQIPQLVIDSKGRVTAASTFSISVGEGVLTVNTSGTGLSGSGTFNANSSSNQTVTISSNATSANTGGAIVARDGSGNFSAGTITATKVTGLNAPVNNTDAATKAYVDEFVNPNFSTYTKQTYTATAAQVNFAIAYVPGYVEVYLNGVKLAASDYSATSGTQVVLASGAEAGDIVELVAFSVFEVADAYTIGQTDDLLAQKQNVLVSGTNIKTVNGNSVLGSGNIQIDGGVVSFNTRTGAITLGSSDVTIALGYTPQPTLVSGTSIKTVNGNSVLGSGDIVIAGGVTSFNTRTGDITLGSSDVTTALGFTPYSATNPSGYITSSALSAYLPLSGGTLSGNVALKTYTQTTSIITASGATNLDLAQADVFVITLSANSTFTFTNAPASGTFKNILVVLVQGTGGSKTASFTGAKYTDSVAPVLTTTAGARDVLAFFTYNGTEYFGSFVMANVV